MSLENARATLQKSGYGGYISTCDNCSVVAMSVPAHTKQLVDVTLLKDVASLSKEIK